MNAGSLKAPALHRRLLLDAQASHTLAAVEDDFHHFEVLLRHDGHRVQGLELNAKRHPLNHCHEAGTLLQQFTGRPLSTRPQESVADINPREHCTHQYDLAIVAMAQSARGGRREYHVVVPDKCDGQPQQASLQRDGQLILEWQLEHTRICAPERWQGLDLKSLMPWALANLGDDDLEAVQVLRRGVLIARGRDAQTLKAQATEDGSPRASPYLAGACYGFAPERIIRAREMGSQIDFSGRSDHLLQDLRSGALKSNQSS